MLEHRLDVLRGAYTETRLGASASHQRSSSQVAARMRSGVNSADY
jgi:hypothetical protein